MILQVENIEFGFEKAKRVLDGITFKTNGSNTVAIVGASGAGKSTILRLLCGIIKKNKINHFEGRIAINGMSPSEYAEQGSIGFMFQETTLFPNLSVLKNIQLPLKILKKKDENGVAALIEMVGLKDFVDYLPVQLSGGMKTRVALARTFITKPDLLLLDEPFGALDIRWKFFLYRELEILRQSYSPMAVIVTHDIQEALLLSNHILVLGSNGKLLKEIHIDKPLPRVFETNAIKDLQGEYLEIQSLIMND